MDNKASTIFVCTNTDCRSRGAQSVLDALQSHLSDEGVTAFQVKPYLCFSACNSGPNVVIADKRCWLSGVQASDAVEIVAFLKGGPPVDRLLSQNDPDLEQMIYDIIDAGLMPEDT
ncbi:(2Fe-2S) ferredoxin domain-containing protein [Pusillimonas noertemannii]|uniref:Thioredoxin-like protein n=1 Tax=Pusillimonas noertemannii TaxID=305977 RepID=A0A2U1CP00_9BURK|nr:(2Fe-2S) ferredoxin domain-containing protein [Pusillimonas noertemannii]NYT68245.1 (2Fe-2S) ferredoxin domain-containing protein [Pusillimonas noertemannii]PVY62740.1 thioredoxin-like protein [Pusillimonas noertemannii]TFL10324.1 (2Fe-2S) ferredoxin domain-containing protein [Pusillimonas noertemannii]